MNILFLCFEYCGNRDASSQCVHNLRKELKRLNVNSDVLTYDWTGKEKKALNDEVGDIYTVPNWYRFARIKRDNAGKIQMSVPKFLLAIFIRLISIMLEGPDYVQRSIPALSTYGMKRKLKNLCQKNRYDWIVSISNPFANHKMLMSVSTLDTKRALYNLDPYWNHQLYDSSSRDKRITEEVKLYKRANAIFCTPEQISDYQNANFKCIDDRIHVLQYPNFFRPKLIKNCGIHFDKNRVNLLYLGSIPKGIRKLDTLFDLFSRSVRFSSNLHLHIVGKVSVTDLEKQLLTFDQSLSSNLTFHGLIPADEVADLLQQANILVNLGNTAHNQMPSKTIQYLACGKPILNISESKECNTLPLLKKYPLCFQVFSEDLISDDLGNSFARFCNRFQKEQLDWDELEKIYPELHAETIARSFYSILNNF